MESKVDAQFSFTHLLDQKGNKRKSLKSSNPLVSVACAVNPTNEVGWLLKKEGHDQNPTQKNDFTWNPNSSNRSFKLFLSTLLPVLVRLLLLKFSLLMIRAGPRLRLDIG
jgi:hypothetical protein